MKFWILPGWSGGSLTLTLGSPQARIRAGEASPLLGGDRSDRRRGYVYEANEKTQEIPGEPNFENGRQPELGSGLEP